VFEMTVVRKSVRYGTGDGVSQTARRLELEARNAAHELRVSRALTNGTGRDCVGEAGVKALDNLLKAMPVACVNEPRREPEDSLLLSQTFMRL